MKCFHKGRRGLAGTAFGSSYLCATLAVGIFFALFGRVDAKTINAASPSFLDVTTAVATAVDGDTVIVPAGTASWTSGLVIAKGITLMGQTTTDSANGTANDQTVLVDNLLHVPGDQGFFKCTANTGQSLRITGITFSGMGGRSDTMYNGAIRLSGTSDQLRIDHCHFTALHHQPAIRVNSTVYGVSDHNVFDNQPNGCMSHTFFNGTGNGDLEFSQSAGWGTSKFFFVEDCYINNSQGAFTSSGGIDAGQAGRFVVRHCKLYDVEILCHGTEADRGRGGRAQELYNNEYHWSYLTTMDGIRSGSRLVHDNTFAGTSPRAYGAQTYRLFYRYPLSSNVWLGGSGDNDWDVNVTESDGVTHIDGHSPYLFGSGIATGGTQDLGTGLQTLTDTSKNWTTNQWAGYTAKRPSDNWIGEIISNTSTTLTMMFYTTSGDPITTWRSGDTYQIHKVLICLDQPGRGAGDSVTGSTPINSTTGTVAWPHQALEPQYSWNNIHSPGGEHINFSPSSTSTATLLQGRDYYNDTAMSGYTPYTYPHPLVGGGLPQPPGNLHVLQ
jgi:hypothetical protein